MITSQEVIAAVGAQPGLLAEAAAQLPANEAKKATAAILRNMPANDAREVAQGALPKAPVGIWYLLIGALCVFVVLFGVLTYVQLSEDKNAEALLGLATVSLGGLVGLIAPSPLSKSQS
jgi:hypothetical protein